MSCERLLLFSYRPGNSNLVDRVVRARRVFIGWPAHSSASKSRKGPARRRVEAALPGPARAGGAAREVLLQRRTAHGAARCEAFEWRGPKPTGAIIWLKNMGASAFPDTRWTMILQAGREDDPAADEALAQLCRAYWYPIYAFVRRQGYPTEESRDLTQGFFAHLLEKRRFAVADRERGRFRSFLLKSLQRFLADSADRDRAAKRGGGVATVPLELEGAETKLARDFRDDETPERLFEREWAMELIARVAADLRGAFDREGRSGQFDRLKQFLPGYGAETSYANAAREMGASEGALKVAVHRLRSRYRDLFHAEIARLVADPKDCEAEIQYILNALRS
jgi:DNA-directed RNA polymerase specialized sigma24 family protein